MLGLLIAVLVLTLQLKNMEEEKKAKLQQQADLNAADQAKALAHRKQALREAEATQLEEVEEFLSANRKADPELRQQALTLALERRFNNHSYRRMLVDEVVNIWSAPHLKTVTKTEPAERTQAFEEQKRAAEALHGEGKLGKAIARMMENHNEFKVHHEEAIDARVLRWSDELTQKWLATKAQVDRLLEEGKGEKAVELLVAAREYGDAAIWRETEALLIQAHSIISRKLSKDEQPADESVEDLEEEFAEEFSEEEEDEEDDGDED